MAVGSGLGFWTCMLSGLGNLLVVDGVLGGVT